MKNYYSILLTSLLLTTMLHSQSDSLSSAYDAATYTTSEGFELPYRILWPANYDKDQEQAYPLLLFLHGAGERGNDNELQLVHGSDLFVDQRTNFPAIVLMPQCATDDYWAQMEKDGDERYFNFDERPNPSLSAVIELLDLMLEQENVDPDRVYLMGLSMGGMGTFELLARRPNTFAAAVPICGGTNPALVSIYARQVPLWIFHGADDQVVNVQQSQRIVERLKNLGYLPRYTEYPGVQHNSWDSAFAEPELLSWLFGQRRAE